MRRDSIFYRLFQQAPTLLFELLPAAPPNAADYRFDAVAIKEPKFEIDGLFLPPETQAPGVVYFCEVQFQRDERLYERLFGEAFLYFYRNRERFSDWQAVVIYPSRAIEQSNTYPYRALLESNQLHRLYLDELGEISDLPLEAALMLLTTVSEAQAPDAARDLIRRAQELPVAESNRAIIELIKTIMIYKFTHLSRTEVEAMLGLTLQETRVYQEAKAEGRQDEAVSLIIRLLTRLLRQELPEPIRVRISALPLGLLEQLGEDLLDFGQMADLLNWLEQQLPPGSTQTADPNRID